MGLTPFIPVMVNLSKCEPCAYNLSYDFLIMQLVFTMVTVEGMIRLMQWKVWGKFSIFIAFVYEATSCVPATSVHMHFPPTHLSGQTCM